MMWGSGREWWEMNFPECFLGFIDEQIHKGGQVGLYTVRQHEFETIFAYESTALNVKS